MSPISTSNPQIRFGLLVLAYLGFISLGLPDASTGVAWPSLKSEFALKQSSLGYLLFFGGAGYLASSFFGGWLEARVGVGTLLTSSCALVALGLFGYSAAPGWTAMFPCAVAIGLGSGAIDAALNHYAAERFPPRHMNWLHSSFGIGAMLGPLIMTSALVRFGSWRMGYAGTGAILLSMGVLFLSTRGSWNTAPALIPTSKDSRLGIVTALRSRKVQLHILVFFLYAGIESTAGQWCYSILSEERGYSREAAGTLTAMYWGGLALGRFLVGAIIARVDRVFILRAALGGTLVGAAIFAAELPHTLQSAGIVLVGLSIAPFFPMLMSDTPSRVGAAYAAHSIGFQVAATTLGIALFPTIAGACAGHFGLEAIPLVLVANVFLFAAAFMSVARIPQRQGPTSSSGGEV